jgi:uncharacterized membrane protein
MIKETLKKEWYILLLLLLPFIASAYLWNDLPQEVPTHFNFKGEADAWGPKWINALLIPAIGVLTYFGLIFLPLIDPKKRIESTQKPIAAIRIILALFMVFIYLFIMAASLGSSINFAVYIQVGVGMLIMVLGNYMNSVKQNYFIGVKTPWTLENGEVWKKTHRLTSKLWTIAGLSMICIPFVFKQELIQMSIYVAVVLVIAFVPILYSYLIFQRITAQN